MDDQRFLNSYHNASTPPGPDVPADLAGFMLAADPILGAAAELSRVLARAHQGAATQLIGEDWAHARKYFSLSEKYAAWADYNAPARGFGIHAYAHQVRRPIRLTDEALRAHPEWRNFGSDEGRHPPMRGWLAVPLIGSDGENYGFIQVSDRLEGDFTAQDEANLVRLASLTATALDTTPGSPCHPRPSSSADPWRSPRSTGSPLLGPGRQTRSHPSEQPARLRLLPR